MSTNQTEIQNFDSNMQTNLLSLSPDSRHHTSSNESLLKTGEQPQIARKGKNPSPMKGFFPKQTI
jgi:hypothetical protein